MKFKWFLSLLFLWISISSFSQRKALSMENRVDSILKLKPTTYKAIDKILKPFQRDSVKVKKLIKHFNKAEYYDGLAYEYIKLGNVYRKYSDYESAVIIHENALKAARKAENKEFEIFSLNMLGVDYRRKNLYTTAINYNKEALAIADKIDNPNSGILRSTEVSYNSIGNIYLLLEQYLLAENSFKKALEIAERSKNRWSISINNENIAKIKEAQDSIDLAINYTKKALSIDESMNNTYGRMICYNRLGKLHIKKGDFEKAKSYLDEAIPLARTVRNPYYIALVNNNLGWVNTKTKHYNKALEHFEESLTIAEKKRYKTALVEVYGNFSEYNQSIGNHDEALKYYKKKVEVADELRNSKTTKYVNDLIVKYDSERKTNQIKDLAKENEITRLKLTRNRVFIIISFVVLLFIASLLYFQYRQYALNKENRILTLEQDALRNQMNPHFIFNALNSIKHYITANEQRSAVYYLNKFSKLIRKILEFTSTKEVSLEEEINAADLYLNIENIRFSNEVDFNITIDENLDITKINVPPLILQPFLENSLWHGLSSIKGTKKLNLSVLKVSDNYVQIEIEDNGIGREAAAKKKLNRTIKRKSVAIALTKERLQNYFSKEPNDFFSLTFIDLIGDNEEPKGTKVEIKIPYIT